MNQKPHQPLPGERLLDSGERDKAGPEGTEGIGLTAESTSLKRPARKEESRLPHERDESPDPLDATHTTPMGGPRQVIEQAASDVSHGLIDTDRHGVPADVPGPAPAPEESPGADVPPEGIDRQSHTRRGEPRPVAPGKDSTHT